MIPWRGIPSGLRCSSVTDTQSVLVAPSQPGAAPGTHATNLWDGTLAEGTRARTPPAGGGGRL